MEDISLPFSAAYGSTALDALGSDRLTVAGGSVIVIGNSPAAVEVRGIIRVAAEDVTIEYRATQAQVLGFVSVPANTELKTVRIPIAAVESIHIRRALFRKPRLILEFNRLDLVPAIPWSETTKVTLTIERADQQRARELAVSMQMHLADARLKRLAED